jgi:ectoine hydroxylase-related dioxygenase (phytanoyl-CoA dioxygenase family)
METYVPLHGEERRLIIPQFVTKSDRLARLLDDSRVTGIVASLLGPEYEYAESDGNLFDCESTWHSDTYGAPMRVHHVKVSFYLDTLRADSGAIRVIPGTNFFDEPFAFGLRQRMHDPSKISEHFGVPDREIPSVVLETDPGDIVVWDFRTIHASFYGGKRRRLFSINFREAKTESDPLQPGPSN